MSLLHDYSRQARTYDETRAASPSVLGPLREALAGAPGRRLADIGGGTGNYARALRTEGWDPVVIDRELAMLARAAAKVWRRSSATRSGCRWPTRAWTRRCWCRCSITSKTRRRRRPRRVGSCARADGSR